MKRRNRCGEMEGETQRQRVIEKERERKIEKVEKRKKERTEEWKGKVVVGGWGRGALKEIQQSTNVMQWHFSK